MTTGWVDMDYSVPCRRACHRDRSDGPFNAASGIGIRITPPRDDGNQVHNAGSDFCASCRISKCSSPAMLKTVRKVKSRFGITTRLFIETTSQFDRKIGFKHTLCIGLAWCHSIDGRMARRVIYRLGKRDKCFSTQQPNGLVLFRAGSTGKLASDRVNVAVYPRPPCWLIGNCWCSQAGTLPEAFQQR